MMRLKTRLSYYWHSHGQNLSKQIAIATLMAVAAISVAAIVAS